MTSNYHVSVLVVLRNHSLTPVLNLLTIVKYSIILKDLFVSRDERNIAEMANYYFSSVNNRDLVWPKEEERTSLAMI